jgi:hypothetical protein
MALRRNILLACALSSLLITHCSQPDKAPPPPPPVPAPAPAPVPAPVATTPTPGSEPEKPALEIATPPAPEPEKPQDVYSGTHKLGVNRVTDMARVGSARFTRRDGALFLEGRVERGAHWLELRGKVEPEGPSKFTMTGTIRGVPDMTWAGEAPRERSKEGRFMFEVRKGRPYFRLYAVNGRDCVCNDDGCGNDFCYIDIEQQPNPEPATGQTAAPSP